MDRSPQKKHTPRGKPPTGRNARASRPDPKRREADGLTLRRIGAAEFAFNPPNLALERQEDLEEVHRMIDGDELDIARDELLYLVADCRDFLEAHNLLGELALRENDLKLARGHFGFAYETAMEILPARFRGRIPAGRDYNPEFFAAGRGLARCLIALNSIPAGREVLEQLARLDPRDAAVKSLLAELDQPSPCVEEAPLLVTLQLPPKAAETRASLATRKRRQEDTETTTT